MDETREAAVSRFVELLVPLAPHPAFEELEQHGVFDLIPSQELLAVWRTRNPAPTPVSPLVGLASPPLSPRRPLAPSSTNTARSTPSPRPELKLGRVPSPSRYLSPEGRRDGDRTPSPLKSPRSPSSPGARLSPFSFMKMAVSLKPRLSPVLGRAGAAAEEVGSPKLSSSLDPGGYFPRAAAKEQAKEKDEPRKLKKARPVSTSAVPPLRQPMLRVPPSPTPASSAASSSLKVFATEPESFLPPPSLPFASEKRRASLPTPTLPQSPSMHDFPSSVTREEVPPADGAGKRKGFRMRGKQEGSGSSSSYDGRGSSGSSSSSHSQSKEKDRKARPLSATLSSLGSGSSLHTSGSGTKWSWMHVKLPSKSWDESFGDGGEKKGFEVLARPKYTRSASANAVVQASSASLVSSTATSSTVTLASRGGSLPTPTTQTPGTIMSSIVEERLPEPVVRTAAGEGEGSKLVRSLPHYPLPFATWPSSPVQRQPGGGGKLKRSASLSQLFDLARPFAPSGQSRGIDSLASSLWTSGGGPASSAATERSLVAQLDSLVPLDLHNFSPRATGGRVGGGRFDSLTSTARGAAEEEEEDDLALSSEGAKLKHSQRRHTLSDDSESADQESSFGESSSASRMSFSDSDLTRRTTRSDSTASGADGPFELEDKKGGKEMLERDVEVTVDESPVVGSAQERAVRVW